MPSAVTVSETTAGAVRFVTVEGVLDSATYRKLRDLVIKAALEEPAAVIVDVNALDVPAPSAWSVFTSVRWHVSTWPDVPIMLACANDTVRATIAHNGVARYVPVYPTTGAAQSAALGDNGRPIRRRARERLPATITSAARARELVTDWLTTWSKGDLIPVAKIVTDALVENALEHTDSAPVLAVESDEETVTVTVADESLRPAARHEEPTGSGNRVAGLAVVAALSRSWASMPTPSGKVVWAAIGPENRL